MEQKDIIPFLPDSTGRKKRIALACPHDEHTKETVERALKQGIASFALFIADKTDSWAKDMERRFPSEVETVECDSQEDAAAKAVEMAKSGKADILMKGTINTDVLLRAALDKERGILKKGKVMTHIAVASIPSYKKPLMFSDAAVVPRPALEQFDAIVGYCAQAARKLGVKKPNIALIHFSEKNNAKFEHTLHYQEIIRRAKEGRYGEVNIGGLMDVKTACDAESGAIKGITSPVVGNADVLIFPNIESGNTFYKTISLFANATTAGWLEGTDVPVIVSSRADTVDSKFLSLALVCRLGE